MTNVGGRRKMPFMQTENESDGGNTKLHNGIGGEEECLH